MTDTERPNRNDPVSALAIRLLVAAGACSQADANTAFHAACSMLEEEAERQNTTLPWVVRKLSPLTDEQANKLIAASEVHEYHPGAALELIRSVERAFGIA